MDDLQLVPVVDIDDPSDELDGFEDTAGDLLVAYQIEAGANTVTIYSWDSANSGGVNIRIC